ncbi:MAG TPA: sigma-70 family RNA polymerase sigma factor [Gemmatales bacterium]|nr:sigma-70 family RNA polymerase sigma factor [Gemmatales bacterium]
MSHFTHSTHIQALLNDHAAGTPAARAALLEYTLERFRAVAQRMFRQEKTLHSLDQTDDVIQKGLIRLNKALETVKPDDVRAFFGLAARQLRFVIADLAEQLHARQRIISIDAVPEIPSHRPGQEPESFLEWAEFHDSVDRLPDEEREVFDLLFYGGMEQQQAAALLGISERTLRRRWQSCKLRLGGS